MIDKVNSTFVKLVDEMKDVPERDPGAFDLGRARFLAEVDSLRLSPSRPKSKQITKSIILHPRPRFAYALIYATLLLAVFFGGFTTVRAAQDDLPTEALYPIKTMSEDVRLGLTIAPHNKIDLLSEFVQTRVQEVTALASLGINPPADVILRLEDEINQAFLITSGMSDDSFGQSLLKIHTLLKEQEKVLLQAQIQGLDPQLLEPIHRMIQERLRLVDEGLVDPNGFRNTIRQENHEELTITSTPQGNPGGLQPSGTHTPGTNLGNGTQYPSGTPTPEGNQNGNGGPQPSHTPNTPGTGEPQPTATDNGQGGGGNGNGNNKP